MTANLLPVGSHENAIMVSEVEDTNWGVRAIYGGGLCMRVGVGWGRGDYPWGFLVCSSVSVF